MRITHFLKHLFFALISLIMTAIIGLAVVIAYLETQLPDVTTLNNVDWQLPLKIYTSDGKLIGEFGPERRTPISINQVPKQLINAILATEDQRFFEHVGVDPWGMGRAILELIITGKKTQGGSTITMQVARNYFLSSEKTYSRKFREMLLAIKIDRTFPKEKILELYLNKIYLGNRAYGVASAAQVYYGKPLNQLTLAELAMLAGIPKAPSQLNPLADKAAAKDRRDHVLARMYQLGYIDKESYEKAVASPLTASYHGASIDNEAPYVAEMVRDAMFAHFGDSVYTRGFTVYTTIVSQYQLAADAALKKAVDAYNKRHGLTHSKERAEGAIVSINPQNGALLALDGGYDYDQSSFNRVTQAQRQPGSTFKPFIYAAALAKGYTLATIIDDAPISIYDPSTGENWEPQNDDHQVYGPNRLREALIHSRNLSSIRLLQQIGVPYAINYATRFGFDTSQLPRNLTMALGTGVVTPLQMVGAYAVFANGGYKVTPYMIDKIVDTNNQVIYQAQPKLACERCISANNDPALPMVAPNQLAPEVITPQVAYLMTSAMKTVITQGTGHQAESLDRSDLAGKTGTMDTDGWFTGYNSDIVTSAWVGFDNNKPINEFGAQAALPMWMDFMRIALAGKPLHTLPLPPGIVTEIIDRQTGAPADKGDSNAMAELFEQNHTASNSPILPAGTPVENGVEQQGDGLPDDQGAPVVDGTKGDTATGDNPQAPPSGNNPPLF